MESADPRVLILGEQETCPEGSYCVEYFQRAKYKKLLEAYVKEAKGTLRFIDNGNSLCIEPHKVAHVPTLVHAIEQAFAHEAKASTMPQTRHEALKQQLRLFRNDVPRHDFAMLLLLYHWTMKHACVPLLSANVLAAMSPQFQAQYPWSISKEHLSLPNTLEPHQALMLAQESRLPSSLVSTVPNTTAHALRSLDWLRGEEYVFLVGMTGMIDWRGLQACVRGSVVESGDIVWVSLFAHEPARPGSLTKDASFAAAGLLQSGSCLEPCLQDIHGVLQTSHHSGEVGKYCMLHPLIRPSPLFRNTGSFQSTIVPLQEELRTQWRRHSRPRRVMPPLLVCLLAMPLQDPAYHHILDFLTSFFEGGHQPNLSDVYCLSRHNGAGLYVDWAAIRRELSKSGSFLVERFTTRSRESITVDTLSSIFTCLRRRVQQGQPQSYVTRAFQQGTLEILNEAPKFRENLCPFDFYAGGMAPPQKMALLSRLPEKLLRVVNMRVFLHTDRLDRVSRAAIDAEAQSKARQFTVQWREVLESDLDFAYFLQTQPPSNGGFAGLIPNDRLRNLGILAEVLQDSIVQCSRLASEFGSRMTHETLFAARTPLRLRHATRDCLPKDLFEVLMYPTGEAYRETARLLPRHFTAYMLRLQQPPSSKPKHATEVAYRDAFEAYPGKSKAFHERLESAFERQAEANQGMSLGMDVLLGSIDELYGKRSSSQ